MPEILQAPRVGVADPWLGAHRSCGGYHAWSQWSQEGAPERLIDIVERSGLTGKGGAGYPTHRKMRLMRAQSAEKKILVVNGSEHEPGSLKDRSLLEGQPHNVLEGALLSALAVGATDVIVAINETATAALKHFREALVEARGPSGIDFKGIRVAVHPVPDIYIVGEETALLEVLEGKPALPRSKPPFPIQQGVFGLPTLVHNVETVAHLPFIAREGAEIYRALGRYGRGVTLCTFGPEFVCAGVHEIPLGTPLRDVLHDWGGGLRGGSRIKAIQPGGPSSGFLPASLLHLPLDAETLHSHGSALGCAVITAYSTDDCMVRELGRIMHFFAHGSCGQCPRCRMETSMLDTILRQVLCGRGNPRLLEQIDKVIDVANGEGICGLIAMPAAPARTCLKYFRDEFIAHIERRCPVCSAQHADSSTLQAGGK